MSEIRTYNLTDLYNLLAKRRFGRRLVVPGHLDLEGEDVRWLPSMHVQGNLGVENTPHLLRLPWRLAVDGVLSMEGSGIRNLPLTLRVGGSIYAQDGTGYPNVEEAREAVLSHWHEPISI